MPIKLPAKVSISPKAMSTEWWISAKGGQQNPASNSKPPYTQRLTDNINCTFFMILENKAPTRYSEIIYLLLATLTKSYKSSLARYTRSKYSVTNYHRGGAAESYKCGEGSACGL